MDLDINKWEEKLIIEELLLKQTEDWWEIEMNKRREKIEQFKEKIESNPIENEDIEEKIEELDKEILHLTLKAAWEKKQIDKFTKNKENFINKKKEFMLLELSKKIKNLNENKS